MRGPIGKPSYCNIQTWFNVFELLGSNARLINNADSLSDRLLRPRELALMRLSAFTGLSMPKFSFEPPSLLALLLRPKCYA